MKPNIQDYPARRFFPSRKAAEDVAATLQVPQAVVRGGDYNPSKSSDPSVATCFYIAALDADGKLLGYLSDKDPREPILPNG